MSEQRSDDGPLPRVQGRHRNAGLAQARRKAAARLVISGWTYQQVADRLGYQNRGTVHRLVQPVLQQTRSAGVEEAFQLHYERLEGLLRANFDQALAGDPGATRLTLQVMRDEAKLFGLGGRAEVYEAQVPYEVIDPAELVRRDRAETG